MKHFPDVTTEAGLKEIESMLKKAGESIVYADGTEGYETLPLLLLTIAKQNVRIIELFEGPNRDPSNVLNAFKPH